MHHAAVGGRERAISGAAECCAFKEAASPCAATATDQSTSTGTAVSPPVPHRTEPRAHAGGPLTPPLLPAPQVEGGATKEPLELLSKAQILTGEAGPLSDDRDVRFRLLAVTLNNLGCYYKRTRKLRVALGAIREALRVEAQTPCPENPAGTLLNLCAVLSQLGRHREALAAANAACRRLHAEAARRGAGVDGPVLAIALHNLAVEREFLGMTRDAEQAYRAAASTAEECWVRRGAAVAAQLSLLCVLPSSWRAPPALQSLRRDAISCLLCLPPPAQGADNPMSAALRQSLEDFYEKPSTVRVLSRAPPSRPQGGSSGYGPNGGYAALTLRERGEDAADADGAGPGPGSATGAARARPGTVSGGARRGDLSRPGAASKQARRTQSCCCTISQRATRVISGAYA